MYILGIHAHVSCDRDRTAPHVYIPGCLRVCMYRMDAAHALFVLQQALLRGIHSLYLRLHVYTMYMYTCIL